MNNQFKTIHRSALRDIALNIELQLNNGNAGISEYDVQEFMYQFLKNKFANTVFRVLKEPDKTDCMIANKKDNTPIILYEMKTFIKSHEMIARKSALKKIKDDFKKLSNIQHTDAEGYFILVFRSKNLNEFSKKEEKAKIIRSKNVNNRSENEKDKILLLENFDWLTKRLNSRSWSLVDNYKLRPSAKEVVLNTYVFSWEIIRDKTT